MPELPAERIDVRITAFMIEAAASTPARSNTRVNGEIAMSVTDTGLGPMVFDRDQYEHTLAEAVPRVDDLPFDVTEFRGKRFLWPWEWGWRV